ncbi:MAG: DUF2905 family protein [Bacillota bacterium]
MGPSGLDWFGRVLVGLGLGLAVLGGLLLLGSHLGLGRLPGDILYRRGNLTVHFPVVSMLVISVVLTVLLNLLLRRR